MLASAWRGSAWLPLTSPGLPAFGHVIFGNFGGLHCFARAPPAGSLFITGCWCLCRGSNKYLDMVEVRINMEADPSTFKATRKVEGWF